MVTPVRLVGRPDTVIDLVRGLSGTPCWKVPRVLLVNERVVGVVTGPVADNVIDVPWQIDVCEALAVTDGVGLTVTDWVAIFEHPVAGSV
jgi:hypothetical protein